MIFHRDCNGSQLYRDEFDTFFGHKLKYWTSDDQLVVHPLRLTFVEFIKMPNLRVEANNITPLS